MVKPAGAYLDVIRAVKTKVSSPVFVISTNRTVRKPRSICVTHPKPRHRTRVAASFSWS